jgi:hypothetical protein
MGTYASVLVFPQEPRKPTLLGRFLRGEKTNNLPALPEKPRDLDGTARRILTCFERHGFVTQGVAETASHTESATFATCDLLGDGRAIPAGLEWRHLAVEPCDLRPTISEIIWTLTAGQFYEESEIPAGKSPEELALPYLDVMVFSREVKICDPVRNHAVCNPWAVIEFSFEDCRLSDEIHRIRELDHPFFRDLTLIFGRDPAWDYCAG